MIKNVSLRWLKNHDACENSIEAFKKQEDHDLISTLKRVIKKDEEWCYWLLREVLPKNLRNAYLREDCEVWGLEASKKLDRKYIKILEKMRNK
jgi:DNA-directed RNA polymerase subunit L